MLRPTILRSVAFKCSFKKTNFLHDYHKSFLHFCYSKKAKFKDLASESISHEDREFFRVTENLNLNLLKANSLIIMISIQAQGDRTKLLQKMRK